MGDCTGGAAALYHAVNLDSSDEQLGEMLDAVLAQCGNTENYKDATYMIDGREVTLVSGVAEIEAAPDATTRTITRYFGNEAHGDVNGDGVEDVVFLLSQDFGGSGTFYYVVVALQVNGGYKGTNAVLLGDRVAPQTTEIHGSEIVVNYAQRAPGEPMTARPSIGVSKYL